MKIAFFGLTNTINFNQIGGMNSLIRRLALCLAKMGDSVDFIHYGAASNDIKLSGDVIRERFFKTIDGAFEYLRSECDHVISHYVRPRERLYYARFRKSQNSSIKFHNIYSVWNESKIKRELLFAEARLFPFNGYHFCVSPRIYAYVSKWARHSALLWPPVSADFFCEPERKPENKNLWVTFAGRADQKKGPLIALDVLKKCAERLNINARMFGYVWPQETGTLDVEEHLLNDSGINYEPVDYRNWTPEVEKSLINVLKETDILLLPYTRLSSTVDTPLLLLEGMANLCAVITPPLGDLHTTYGDSVFNLPDDWSTDTVVRIIETAHNHLAKERERLTMKNAVLQFETERVAQKFRSLILGSY